MTIVIFILIIFFYYDLIKKIILSVINVHKVNFLNEYVFPKTIFDKVRVVYPELKTDDLNLISQGLRQYFMICIKSGNKVVAMPSQAVDVAWHEFVLHGMEYHEFCSKAFGRYLHHRHFYESEKPEKIVSRIKIAWQQSCDLEKIDIHKPGRTPILFYIDYKLNICDGNEFCMEVANHIENSKYDRKIYGIMTIRELLEASTNDSCNESGDGAGGCGG